MKHFSVFCFLLLTLVRGALPAQHLTVAQADSLKEVLSAGKADTNHVRILLRLSNYYGRKTWQAAANRDTA